MCLYPPFVCFISLEKICRKCLFEKQVYHLEVYMCTDIIQIYVGGDVYVDVVIIVKIYYNIEYREIVY